MSLPTEPFAPGLRRLANAVKTDWKLILLVSFLSAAGHVGAHIYPTLEKPKTEYSAKNTAEVLSSKYGISTKSLIDAEYVKFTDQMRPYIFNGADKFSATISSCTMYHNDAIAEGVRDRLESEGFDADTSFNWSCLVVVDLSELEQ